MEEKNFSRDIKRAKAKGMPDKEILDMVRRIIKRESKPDCIIVKKDYRIFIDKANKKEVKLAALPKALYLFFLKHTEGVRRNDLFKYMPEITYIYLKVRTRRVAHPINTIKNMLVGNQFPNNMMAIRNAFQKTFGMQHDNIYTINSYNHYAKPMSIGISASRRIWQCPDLLSKKIPTLSQKTTNIISATWNILHELKDPEIDEAIGITKT